MKEYGFVTGRFSRNATVTIGKFDGVHRGHASLIDYTKSIAQKNNSPTGIITFDPSPIEFFNAHHNRNFYLTSLQDRISYILNTFNVDFVYILRFNKEISSLSATDFFNKVLLDKLGVNSIVIGQNHTFGQNQSGNINTMKELCSKNNIDLSISDLHIEEQGQVISSGIIRKYIEEGNLKKAKNMLGRNFVMSGIVIKGSNIAGIQLNHKTANIFLETQYISPKYGVYATLTKLHGKIYKSVANFGIRPTFNHTNPVLEVHILDNVFPDFYGEKISVELVEFIRPEKKFSSIEELKNQINIDCEMAKQLIVL